MVNYVTFLHCCQTFPICVQSSTSGLLFSFVLPLFWSTGISGLIMCVALLAYGREELHHGKPETDVYEMKVETLVELDFKEAFLDVSFTEKCILRTTCSARVRYESTPSVRKNFSVIHNFCSNRKLGSKSKWKVQWSKDFRDTKCLGSYSDIQGNVSEKFFSGNTATKRQNISTTGLVEGPVGWYTAITCLGRHSTNNGQIRWTSKTAFSHVSMSK